MVRLLWIALGLCLLAGAVAGLALFGSRRWATTVRTLTRRLETPAADVGARSPRPARYNVRELEHLPAPVQRYFRAVLRDGQPIIASVTADLTGTFNMSPTGQQWKPFTSRQRVVTARPGFVWDAQVQMLPGVAVRVVDSYVAGEGQLRAAVLGLLTVAEMQGGGEIARGEFMRFFAEAAWYPTVLLPSQGVRWETVDDTSAHATIVDGRLTLTLLFRFNDAGLIDSFRAEARGATVGKETVMLPWEGKWSNYQVCNGMTVPFTGEVAWVHPDGPRPYFVGTVTSMVYEFVPA